MAPTKRIILGITGATGMLYVPSLLQLLASQQVETHGIISTAGRQVLHYELGLSPDELNGVGKWFKEDNIAAAPASGSARYDAMVVLPCTMGSLAAIAGGFCGNLIHRAADVTLKERRPLILAVRETPLNRTHLKNMLRVHDAGATVCPPMPGFYNQPKDFKAMAINYAGRICDLLGLSDHQGSRWQGVE
ncbi:UbiX family flavin prenyltransferase [Desulfogranum mediterraneum]|uniref:UbiX family flavin prenyltransferase n=1 Tax=Desulfogranum mediterraneum TaxID=160661 RepID=UPI000406F0B3|nr:UbiX family flavin prenyltransferase [Desulfogranum mediterraneum]